MPYVNLCFTRCGWVLCVCVCLYVHTCVYAERESWTGTTWPAYSLGRSEAQSISWSLSPPRLVCSALRDGMGKLTSGGNASCIRNAPPTFFWLLTDPRPPSILHLGLVTLQKPKFGAGAMKLCIAAGVLMVSWFVLVLKGERQGRFVYWRRSQRGRNL